MGGRDRAALERLVKRLKRWNARLYCADEWTAYAEVLQMGRLFVGKDGRHGIERDHARPPAALARPRFRRRSIVVSRAVRLVDASIALFAAFAEIQNLLPMLA